MNNIDQLIRDIQEYSAPFEPNIILTITVMQGYGVELTFAVDHGDDDAGNYTIGDTTIEQAVRRLHEQFMHDEARRMLYAKIVFDRTTSELQKRAADYYNDAIFYRIAIDTAERQTYNGRHAAFMAAGLSAEARARMGITDDDQYYS